MIMEKYNVTENINMFYAPFWPLAAKTKNNKTKQQKKRKNFVEKKVKRKVQGVPQSQAAALPRHQEEEELDKTKQAQFEQMYEKH